MKDSYSINLMNDGKTNLGLEFIKAHYVRPDGQEREWETYKQDEQHRIDAINKVAHLIGSITINYTLIPNESNSYYSISAIFHMNQSMNFGSDDNLFLDEKEQPRDQDWKEFIQSLINDEQWNDLSYAGVERTLIFYCESY